MLKPLSRTMSLLLSIAGLLSGLLLAFSGDEMLNFISVFIFIPSLWFVILNSNENLIGSEK